MAGTLSREHCRPLTRTDAHSLSTPIYALQLSMLAAGEESSATVHSTGTTICRCVTSGPNSSESRDCNSPRCAGSEEQREATTHELHDLLACYGGTRHPTRASSAEENASWIFYHGCPLKISISKRQCHRTSVHWSLRLHAAILGVWAKPGFNVALPSTRYKVACLGRASRPGGIAGNIFSDLPCFCCCLPLGRCQSPLAPHPPNPEYKSLASSFC